MAGNTQQNIMTLLGTGIVGQVVQHLTGTDGVGHLPNGTDGGGQVEYKVLVSSGDKGSSSVSVPLLLRHSGVPLRLGCQGPAPPPSGVPRLSS